MGVASIVYNGNMMSDINSGQSNATLALAVMMNKGAMTFVGLLLVPIIQVVVIEKKQLSCFFPRRSWNATSMTLFSIATIAFIVAISPITLWNATWKLPAALSELERWAVSAEESSGRIISILTSQTTIAYTIGAFVVVALLPAIGEEFVFRGIIQNHLTFKFSSYHTAIWVGALIFSLAHFQIYGLIPRVMFGALFGYAYHWSGNLIYPITMHFVNNALLLMLSYGRSVGFDESSLDQLKSPATQWVILAGLIFASILYFISKIHVHCHRAVNKAQNL